MIACSHDSRPQITWDYTRQDKQHRGPYWSWVFRYERWCWDPLKRMYLTLVRFLELNQFLTPFPWISEGVKVSWLILRINRWATLKFDDDSLLCLAIVLVKFWTTAALPVVLSGDRILELRQTYRWNVPKFHGLQEKRWCSRSMTMTGIRRLGDDVVIRMPMWCDRWTSSLAMVAV